MRHRTPFTIQLLYGSTGYTQEVILGVDAGSKTIGLSAATETEELFSAEVKPRNDVVELMSARRQFRRARRNRTTRYRKPRFDNRVRSKHKKLACALRGGQDSGAHDRHPACLRHPACQQGGCGDRRVRLAAPQGCCGREACSAGRGLPEGARCTATTTCASTSCGATAIPAASAGCMAPSGRASRSMCIILRAAG